MDVAKGIEESTLMTLSQQIEEEIPQANVLYYRAQAMQKR